MKTPATTEAMPSTMDGEKFTNWCVTRNALLKALNAPALDVPYGPECVGWVFDYSLQEAKSELDFGIQLLSKVDPHERWTPEILSESLADICRLFGLPPDAKRNQQPTDLRLAIGVPLSGASLLEYLNDPFDPERPLEWLTPELLVLWIRWLKKKAEQYQAEGVPIEDRMTLLAPEFKLVGMRLLALTCPEGLSGRLKALFDVCDYLKFTSGCHDLVSGHLTDDGRELATMREFNMNGGAA
jgi:hypothetical protein